jgi:hypothetical protein
VLLDTAKLGFALAARCSSRATSCWRSSNCSNASRNLSCSSPISAGVGVIQVSMSYD